jgi:hypothetical protein
MEQVPNEFEAYNTQGCYLWDGTLESFYGEREQTWDLPQDGSLTEKWAIAVNVACTVGDKLKCAPAHPVDKPQPRPNSDGIIFIDTGSGDFADRCLQCSVQPIIPDTQGGMSVSPVRASLTVRRDGTVANIRLDSPVSKGLKRIIADQLTEWLFEPARSGAGTVEVKKDVSMVLMCSGISGKPETSRCTLHPQNELRAPI